MLELKFKKSAMAMAGSMSADALKLAGVDGPALNQTLGEHPEILLPTWQPGWKVLRAVLLVWREGDVAEAMQGKSEKGPIRKQMMSILKGLCAAPRAATSGNVARAMLGGAPVRPVDTLQGHLRFGSTKTSKRYWVAILKYQTAWSTLGST